MDDARMSAHRVPHPWPIVVSKQANRRSADGIRQMKRATVMANKQKSIHKRGGTLTRPEASAQVRNRPRVPTGTQGFGAGMVILSSDEHDPHGRETCS